ncbi:MAG: hypothetical protein ACR2MB_12325, partial [Acidimicrobiales bacterium]
MKRRPSADVLSHQVTMLGAPKMQQRPDQLVATLHAGNPRHAWTPVRQAAFFQAQIDSGQNLKAL